MEGSKLIKLDSSQKIGTVFFGWVSSLTISMAEVNEILTTLSTLCAISYTVYRVVRDQKEKKELKQNEES